MIPNMDPRDASASKKVLVDWESTNLTQEDCADLAAYGNIPSGPTFLSAPGPLFGRTVNQKIVAGLN